ncbi:MAG: hypothetical protein GY744_14680 [Gammaproteobacteria bacterium]|nr:hypothetical protein [Gammaproteobacteria bacterium]
MRSIIYFFHLLGYVLLIVPPRAIDLTVSERARRGELAKQPLFIVMIVELLIRIALILLVAVSLESLLSNNLYESYMLDTVFGMIVCLGICHSFCYFLLLGYLHDSIGLKLGMRLYRLLRNLCYAAIPGLVAVVPLLLWKWNQAQMPFEDGLVYQVYSITTLLMIIIGVVEALIMKRKPLGLDVHLPAE